MPPPRKRRRIQETEDVEMADAIASSSNPVSSTVSPDDPLRPIILETSKESYLLSPSVRVLPDPTSSDNTQAKPSRVYDIALILEAETEVVVEAEAEDEPEQEPDTKEAVPDTETTELEAKPDDDTTNAVEGDTNDAPPSSTELQKEESAGTKTFSSTPAIAESSTTPQDPPSTQLPQPSPTTPAAATSTSAMEQIPNLGSSPLPAPPHASPTHSPIHSPNLDSSTELPPSSPLADRPKAIPTNPDLEAGTETETEADLGSNKPAPFTVQVLQRNLSEEMFRFTDEGVVVLESVSSLPGENAPVEGATAPVEAEWVIQVKDWKWSPRGAIIV